MPEEYNGGRAVTNSDLQRELRVLNAEINGKLDLMIQKADYAEKAQEALRIDVNKNSDEILGLRQRAHDNANGIQALELRTAPLSLALSTELVSGMAEIRRGVEIIRGSDVKAPFIQKEIDGLRDLIRRDDVHHLVAFVKKLQDLDAVQALDDVTDLLAARRRREAKWFGLPREIVGGTIALIIFLLLTTMWSYIRNKYLGLP